MSVSRRAFLGGLHSIFYRAVAAYHNNRSLAIGGFNFFKHLHAIHLRHFNVQKGAIVIAFLQHFKRLGAVHCFVYLVALVL